MSVRRGSNGGIREPDAVATLELIADLAVQLAREMATSRGPNVLARRPLQSREISAFDFEPATSCGPGYERVPTEGRQLRAAREPLPDPQLVRRIIRQRQLRARFFDADLFADPAWDMLLDLTAARVEQSRVSVTSLCIASGVPATTALRWIGQMREAGLLVRTEDEVDRRRAFITLTDKAVDAMARYFAELGKTASQLI